MGHRRLPRLGSYAWLALAAVGAFPALAQTAGATPPVRLLVPAAGDGLVAGGTAELAWEPLDSFASLGRVEEWEAFLSLDGGATYPFRLTPHLDQDVRRFRWRVPAAPTEDARLLFRFGDERRETAVALPQRFVIRTPAVPAPLGDETFGVRRSSRRLAGEPALPGQRGVIAWVEGSRRGTGLRQVVGLATAQVVPARAVPESPLATDVESTEDAPLEAVAARRATAEELPSTDRSESATPGPPRPCGDLLLLTHRQNE